MSDPKRKPPEHGDQLYGIARPCGPKSAEVIQVIRTLANHGYGTEDDPVWPRYQYWSFDGELLASQDFPEERSDCLD